MSVKENMQSSFDSIMAWVDAIAKENEALKSENATLREVLAANKIDISQAVFNIKAKYDENLQNLLDRNLDIDELGLSVRTYNCLRAADICTIADLVQYSRRELMKFRNFGRKSLSEIDNLFDRLSKQLGFNIYYEMIPMSEITKAKIWYQRGGLYSIPYDAWKTMTDKEKIETYHNFV